MMKCRMSLSYSEEMDVWLERKAEETGATKAGVLRVLTLKAMMKDLTKDGKRVSPRRK